MTCDFFVSFSVSKGMSYAWLPTGRYCKQLLTLDILSLTGTSFVYHKIKAIGSEMIRYTSARSLAITTLLAFTASGSGGSCFRGKQNEDVFILLSWTGIFVPIDNKVNFLCFQPRCAPRQKWKRLPGLWRYWYYRYAVFLYLWEKHCHPAHPLSICI